MGHRSRVRLTVGGGVLTLVLLGAVSGAGRSASAEGLRPYSFLAETMQPVESVVFFDSRDAYLRTTLYLGADAPAYIGRLDLPDRVRIVAVRGYGVDTDPVQEFAFAVYRYSQDTDPTWSLVGGTAGSGVSFAGGKTMVAATVVPERALVDQEHYSYGLYLSLPVATPGQQLGVLRFVVDVTYPTTLEPGRGRGAP